MAAEQWRLIISRIAEWTQRTIHYRHLITDAGLITLVNVCDNKVASSVDSCIGYSLGPLLQTTYLRLLACLPIAYITQCTEGSVREGSVKRAALGVLRVH